MNDPVIGQINMFAGNFAPRGWALCDGQLLSISQHQALFSILGTTYGGDGRTTFALPDLRGRGPVHAGTGPGLSRVSLGQKGGAETVALSANQMPVHHHEVNCTAGIANQDSPVGHIPGAEKIGVASIWSDAPADGAMSADTIGPAGESQPHENRSPFLGMNYVIALEGTFPSRS